MSAGGKAADINLFRVNVPFFRVFPNHPNSRVSLDQLCGEPHVRRNGIMQDKSGDSRRRKFQSNRCGLPLGGKSIPAAGQDQYRRAFPPLAVFIIIL